MGNRKRNKTKARKAKKKAIQEESPTTMSYTKSTEGSRLPNESELARRIARAIKPARTDDERRRAIDSVLMPVLAEKERRSESADEGFMERVMGKVVKIMTGKESELFSRDEEIHSEFAPNMSKRALAAMTAEEAANMITRTLLSVRPSDADRDDLVGRVLEPIAEARMFHRRPIEGKWMEEVLRRVNVTMEKAHIEERKEQQQPSDDDVENLSAALGQLYQTMLKNRGCSVELVGSDSEGDKEIDSSLGSDIDPKDDGSDVMVEITPRDANYVCGMEEARKIQEEMEMLKQHPGMLQDCEVPPFYFGIASLNMDDLTYVVIQALRRIRHAGEDSLTWMVNHVCAIRDAHGNSGGCDCCETVLDHIVSVITAPGYAEKGDSRLDNIVNCLFNEFLNRAEEPSDSNSLSTEHEETQGRNTDAPSSEFDYESVPGPRNEEEELEEIVHGMPGYLREVTRLHYFAFGDSMERKFFLKSLNDSPKQWPQEGSKAGNELVAKLKDISETTSIPEDLIESEEEKILLSQLNSANGKLNKGQVTKLLNDLAIVKGAHEELEDALDGVQPKLRESFRKKFLKISDQEERSKFLGDLRRRFPASSRIKKLQRDKFVKRREDQQKRFEKILSVVPPETHDYCRYRFGQNDDIDWRDQALETLTQLVMEKSASWAGTASAANRNSKKSAKFEAVEHQSGVPPSKSGGKSSKKSRKHRKKSEKMPQRVCVDQKSFLGIDLESL
eukprot:73818_1